MLLVKLIGLVIFLIGLAIIKFFPDIHHYQWEEMTVAGVFIGVIFFVIGLIALIFG